MPTAHGKRYYVFEVKCNRCREIVEGRLDLNNELLWNTKITTVLFWPENGNGQWEMLPANQRRIEIDIDRKLLERQPPADNL